MKKESDICSQKCKSDCNTKQYFTEISKYVGLYPINFEDRTYIDIKHNYLPDVIVRHTLEMTLMSFVCNFGGLLGMWLGFSVLSISKDIFDSFRRFCRFNSIKINIIKPNIFKISYFNIVNKQNSPIKQNNFPLVEIEL